jgi:hypothetical protein
MGADFSVRQMDDVEPAAAPPPPPPGRAESDGLFGRQLSDDQAFFAAYADRARIPPAQSPIDADPLACALLARAKREIRHSAQGPRRGRIGLSVLGAVGSRARAKIAADRPSAPLSADAIRERSAAAYAQRLPHALAEIARQEEILEHAK